MAAARVLGDAAVPTSVDLFINGYRSGSTQLQPGPFTLTNLPYINGAGDAVLVTTDALGRQVSTTLPFYVTSDLLKQGLSDGAVTWAACGAITALRISTTALRQAAARIAMG